MQVTQKNDMISACKHLLQTDVGGLFLDILILIARTVGSIILGLAAGWGTVYVFNRVPAKWLCDYDEKPDEKLHGERIGRYPWGWAFSLLFIGFVFFMWDKGIIYQIAGIFALWMLLLIALADIKYMIIPDQFVFAVAVTAIGFVPFQPYLLSPLFGALIGGGCFLIIGIAAKLVMKKEAMGFGDIKLMAAVGLMAGTKGAVIIFILTIFLSGIVMGTGLLTGRIKRGDEKPLGPYIAAASSMFILLPQWLLFVADLYLGR